MTRDRLTRRRTARPLLRVSAPPRERSKTTIIYARPASVRERWWAAKDYPTDSDNDRPATCRPTKRLRRTRTAALLCSESHGPGGRFAPVNL